MASVAPSFQHVGKTDVVSAVWALAAGDTGKKASLSMYPDKTVHVRASSWGSITLRGSNKLSADDTVASDWFTLSDPQGNDLTFSANGGALISEAPLHISPVTTGGSGYEIEVVGGK